MALSFFSALRACEEILFEDRETILDVGGHALTGTLSLGADYHNVFDNQLVEHGDYLACRRALHSWLRPQSALSRRAVELKFSSPAYCHWIPLRGIGGGMGIRTPDLLIANETLYQLSYTPKLLISMSYIATPQHKKMLVYTDTERSRHTAPLAAPSETSANFFEVLEMSLVLNTSDRRELLCYKENSQQDQNRRSRPAREDEAP